MLNTYFLFENMKIKRQILFEFVVHSATFTQFRNTKTQLIEFIKSVLEESIIKYRTQIYYQLKFVLLCVAVFSNQQKSD